MQKSTDRDPKTGRFLPRNKEALKSGTTIFIQSGKIPSEIRGAATLRKDLKRIRGELEKMLGQDNLNVKSELLIDQVISSTGFIKLFELFIKRSGLLNPHLARKRVISFQPGFTTYLSFMSKQKDALQALDLSTQQAKVITPLELAKELDQENT